MSLKESCQHLPNTYYTNLVVIPFVLVSAPISCSEYAFVAAQWSHTPVRHQQNFQLNPHLYH